MRTITLVWLSAAVGSASAFNPGPSSPAVRGSPSVVRRLAPLESSLTKNALYADQQAAQDRQAVKEGELLSVNIAELLAPKTKKGKPKQKAGTGFGKSATTLSPRQLLGDIRAKHLQKEGVIRMQGVLSPDIATQLREFVLAEEDEAREAIKQDPSVAKMRFGIEPEREARSVIMLPLADKAAVVATALHELLVGEGDGEGGEGGGELGALFEALVGEDAQLYEHCALITDNGCPRQTVHADTPYQTHAPLYAAFIALQDVTEEMGPTMYIPRTFDEKSKGRKSFDKGGGGSESREEMLGTTKSLLATLKKGDVAIFDTRTLHAGTANKCSLRVLFNITFRNPKATEKIGHKGSMRPGYKDKLTLGQMREELAKSGCVSAETFEFMGDGLTREPTASALEASLGLSA